MYGENLPKVNTIYGNIVSVIDIDNIALRYDRDPTTSDISKEGRLWINRLTSKIFILTDVSGVPASANWKEIADATPDGTDGQVLIGASGAVADWASITSTGGTLVFTPGTNSLNMEVSGATTSSFPTDSGTATPLLGATQIAGDGSNTQTSGAGNIVTVGLVASPSVTGSLAAGTSITATTSVTAGDSLTMTAGTCTITADDNTAKCIYLHEDAGVNGTIEIHADQSTSDTSIYAYSDVGGVKLASGLASANALVFDASAAAGGITSTYGTSGYGITGTNGAFTLATGTGTISLGADAAAKDIVIGNSTAASSLTCDVGTGDAKFGTTATAHDSYLGSTTTTSGTIVQSGSSGTSITSTGTIDADATGAVSLNSSGAPINVANDNVDQACNIATAGNRTTTIGASGGSSALDLLAGSSNMTLTSAGTIVGDATGAITWDAGGVYEVNSDGGNISIGNDADDYNLALGTGGNRAISCGATGGTTSLAFSSGTSTTFASDGTTDIDCVGNMALNSSGGTMAFANDAVNQNVSIATAGNRTIGIGASGGTSTLNMSSGSGGTAFASDGTTDIDCAGNMTLNSSAGTISIANDAVDQNVSIATAGNRAISLGASGGTSSLSLDSGSGNTAMSSDGTTTVDSVGNLEFNSSGGLVQIAHDAVNQNVNIATAGNRAVSLGASGGTSSLSLDSGSGNTAMNSDGTTDIDSVGNLSLNSSAGTTNIATDAVNQNVSIATAGNRTISFGVTGGTSTLALDSGSGGTTHTTDGTYVVDATGAITVDSTGGATNICTGANAQACNVCTGAAARDLTLGSTNTTSGTTIQAGTSGIALNAAGIVTMTPATATVAGVALTINANAGYGVFTGVTTAASGTETFTITNSICTANSVVFCDITTLGSNDAQLTKTRTKPGAGSFVVTCQNFGAAAVNGNVIVTFWIIQA